MDLQFQMNQLVSLAIGTPEVGAVNFNLLQRFLLEMLKMTDLDSATVTFSPEEVAKLGENTLKPVTKGAEKTDEEGTSPKKSGFHQCPIDPQKVDQLLEDLTQVKFDLEDLTSKVKTMEGATETVPFQEMRNSLSQVDGLQERIKKLEGMLESLKDLGTVEDKGTVGQRLDFLESTLTGHIEQMAKINQLEEKSTYITEQFADLQQEMGLLNEKINIKNISAFDQRSVQDRRVSSAPDQTTSSINNIIARLSSVQHDLDNLTMVTTNLTEEQDQRQMVIDTLSEQIEVLKISKADKTNVEDILASKADMSQVHRKVSHDHFEIKIEGLSTKMEDAFNRLDVHEDMWQEEVEALKADIENKMDKTEFSPLKDYVNEKLKQIQDKMKILAAQKREGEAAGSKRKIIRDVQCISCDNKSVMKVENTLEDVTPPPPLPPSQSVKPFLTYKLDQVRKQQQKLPGKNLNHFEEMLHDAANQLTKTPSHKNGSGEGHLVNRYVGGSHTTTTPQQRVTRTGNFYQTWGPIITAVNPPPPQQPAA